VHVPVIRHHFIRSSADSCVTATVPVTLVVLGAFFYSPPQPQAIALPSDPESPPSDTSNRSLGGYFDKLRAFAHRPKTHNDAYPGENKTVFVAIVSRMIIVPLLMLPILAIIAKFDLFEAAADPVFILSAVLLVSSVSRRIDSYGLDVWLIGYLSHRH